MKKSWEIPIEGHQLVAVSTNSNPTGVPVVFLHGIGGSLYFWTTEHTALFDPLGPGYSLSLPGHYPAAFPPNFEDASLTAESIAKILAGAVREIVGSQKVILVGHSTGGFSALSLGIYAPEVVAGIICIGGFAKGQWTGAFGFSQWLVRQGALGRAIFKGIYRLGGVNPTIYRLLWQIHVHNQTALFRYWGFNTVVNDNFPAIRKLDLEAMRCYYRVMPHIDITPALHKITAPTYIMAGDCDPTVAPIQSHIIAEKVAHSKLAVLKGVGHLPFFEKPVEYKRIMETWITQLQSLI